MKSMVIYHYPSIDVLLQNVSGRPWKQNTSRLPCRGIIAEPLYFTVMAGQTVVMSLTGMKARHGAACPSASTRPTSRISMTITSASIPTRTPATHGSVSSGNIVSTAQCVMTTETEPPYSRKTTKLLRREAFAQVGRVVEAFLMPVNRVSQRGLACCKTCPSIFHALRATWSNFGLSEDIMEIETDSEEWISIGKSIIICIISRMCFPYIMSNKSVDNERENLF